MYFNNTALRIAKEIEEFVTVKKKEDGAFDAIGFTNKVEHTRLTTHMDLQKAFEYERNKQIRKVDENEKEISNNYFKPYGNCFSGVYRS